MSSLNRKIFFKRPLHLLATLLIFGTVTLSSEARQDTPPRWWKGNLHTHSLWSDGDNYPDMIVDWYKQHGYDFLALSDHNILMAGEHWTNPATNKGHAEAYENYLKRFGSDWVQSRGEGTNLVVQLKTLQEFRGRFEEPGKFLLIPGEEITDRYRTLPVHMNVSNVRDLIKPQHGSNVMETMQNNVTAVLEQRVRTGQPMIPHINHPNFGWGVTAEDIAGLKGERFFEVYNGNPDTRNYGDTNHPGMDRLWDIVLTLRAAAGMEPVWGTGVDDSHHYQSFGTKKSNTGRGWIMVRCSELSPAAIISAMESGDFYASSGVQLKEVRRESSRISVEITPEEGVTYTIRFVGTKKGYNSASEPGTRPPKSEWPTTRQYSGDVGATLAEIKGTSAEYKFKGDELYVRAIVTSSKLKPNPFTSGELEMAWVQPVVTGVK